MSCTFAQHWDDPSPTTAPTGPVLFLLILLPLILFLHVIFFFNVKDATEGGGRGGAPSSLELNMLNQYESCLAFFLTVI